GALLLTSLAIMGSPGPATISLTAAGSAYGVRRAAGYLTGVVARTTAVLIAVATRITTAPLAVPRLRAGLIAGSGRLHLVAGLPHRDRAPGQRTDRGEKLALARRRSALGDRQPEGLDRDRRCVRERSPRHQPGHRRGSQDLGAHRDDHLDQHRLAYCRGIARPRAPRPPPI